MIKFSGAAHRAIAGAVVCMVAGLTLGTAGPAVADTTVGGRGLGELVNIAYSGTLNWWAGGYQTSNGLGFCLQPTLNASTGLGISDPQPLTYFVNDQGVPLTTAQLNQLAYVMWVASMNPNPSNGDAVAYKFVVTTLLGYDAVPLFMGGGKLSVPHNLSLDYPDSDATKFARQYGVLDQALTLLAQARAEANNWDGTGAFSLGKVTSPGDKLTASVRLPGMNDGFPVAFTITKPDGTIDSVSAGTNGGVASLSYTPKTYGHYQVSAKFGKAAAPSYPMAAISGSGTQSLLLLTGEPRDWAGQGAFDLVRPTPTIATQASRQLALPGETLNDTVRLSHLVRFPDTTYVLQSRIYQLAPNDDWTCPGPEDPAWLEANVLMQVPEIPVPDDARDADGGAVMVVGEWTVPDDIVPSCISYGESVAMLVDGEVAAWVDHPVGSVEQSALVLPVPKIATNISAPTLKADDVVADTVVLTGLGPGDMAGYAFTGQLIQLRAREDGTCPGFDDPAWADGEVLVTFDGAAESPPAPDGEPSGRPVPWPTGSDPEPGGTPSGPVLNNPSTGVTLTGVGEWTVPSRPETMCVTYAETVTMSVPGHDPIVVKHPAGHEGQTALIPGFIVQSGGWRPGDSMPVLAVLLMSGFGGLIAGAWAVRRLV